MAKQHYERNDSGKTRFNRGKPNGVSWVDLREQAIKNGTWAHKQKSA